MGSSDLPTIIITITDFDLDYKHLRPHIRFSLLNEILYKVVSEYLIAMESKYLFTLTNDNYFRRMSFKDHRERHLAAERIKSDALEIEKLFESLNDGSDYPVILKFQIICFSVPTHHVYFVSVVRHIGYT